MIYFYTYFTIRFLVKLHRELKLGYKVRPGSIGTLYGYANHIILDIHNFDISIMIIHILIL